MSRMDPTLSYPIPFPNWRKILPLAWHLSPDLPTQASPGMDWILLSAHYILWTCFLLLTGLCTICTCDATHRGEDWRYEYDPSTLRRRVKMLRYEYERAPPSPRGMNVTQPNFTRMRALCAEPNMRMWTCLAFLRWPPSSNSSLCDPLSLIKCSKYF